MYLTFDELVNYMLDQRVYLDDDVPLLFQSSQYCLVHAAGSPEGVLKDMLLGRIGTHHHGISIIGHHNPQPFGLLQQQTSLKLQNLCSKGHHVHSILTEQKSL